MNRLKTAMGMVLAAVIIFAGCSNSPSTSPDNTAGSNSTRFDNSNPPTTFINENPYDDNVLTGIFVQESDSCTFIMVHNNKEGRIFKIELFFVNPDMKREISNNTPVEVRGHYSFILGSRCGVGPMFTALQIRELTNDKTDSLPDFGRDQ